MSVRVVDAYVVKTITSEPQYYFVEDELPIPKDADFTKWCNNTGHWDLDPKVFEPTLAEFSLWTYEVTKGYMIVCDLQGVKRSFKDSSGRKCTEYVLTDPAINCTDPRRFSETNLADKAVIRCVRGAANALELSG